MLKSVNRINLYFSAKTVENLSEGQSFKIHKNGVEREKKQF